MTQLRCGDHCIDLSQPVVMGILNTTPDSFSDGGKFFSGKNLQVEKALQRAATMAAEGAAIIDVGGESTRPGASPVSEGQELDRVVPVVERICSELDVVVSVDTSSAKVIHEAASAGAGLINDVRALRREGALQAAVQAKLPVCLMHMQGKPETMQQQVSYGSVFDEVLGFLLERAEVAEKAGVSSDSILLDPGYGFGKSLQHNLQLVEHLPDFVQSQYPILTGFSRKSMIGAITGKPVDQRLAGSLSLALVALQAGVKVLRVHDVAETVDVIRIWSALNGEKGK